MKRRTLLQASAATAVTLAAPMIQAQTLPAGPIRIVVGFPPGGGTDALARVLAQKLQAMWGINIVIDNKAGAAGVIAADYVAKQPADGNTLLMAHINSHALAPSLQPKLAYNVERDFTPIGLVGVTPNLLICNENQPAKTVKDLVALCKKSPGQISFASAGGGSAQHLALEMFKLRAGIDALHVPYKGSGPALTDLIGGQIDLMCDQTTNTTAQIQGGTIKAYAVTSKQRVATLPDLPTMDESGFKGFEVGIWHGMWVPKNTPAPVRAKLLEALQAGLADPKFQERMAALGAQVLTKDANPAALDAKVKQQVPQWAELFKKAGVEAQ
jgi:tripartite-type tricarboxylate transporter receptor subunit TctC